MLDEFVQLANASDEEIARYSFRHGLLYVCDKHFLPSSHLLPMLGGPGPLSFPQCHPIGAHRVEAYATPVSVWRYWARVARATLRVSARLDRDRPGDPADWHAIAEQGLNEWRSEMRRHLLESPFLREASGTIAIPWETSYGEALTLYSDSWLADMGEAATEHGATFDPVHAERRNLGFAISQWLRLAGVMLHLNWDGRRPDVTLQGGSLFGALGIQLMLAVSRADGLATCMSCGEPYVPKRRPSLSRRNYCTTCGRKAAIRDAASAFRKREKGKQSDGKARKR